MEQTNAKDASAERFSRLTLYVGIFVLVQPVYCCLLPSALSHGLFRLTHGGWPIGSPSQYTYGPGMTMEDVKAELGPPHDQYDSGDGNRFWYYHSDLIGGSTLRIEFNPAGVVVSAREGPSQP